MPATRPTRRIPGTIRPFEFNGEQYEAPLLPDETVTDVMSLINPMESCVPQKTLEMFQEWDTFAVTSMGRKVPIRKKEIR